MYDEAEGYEDAGIAPGTEWDSVSDDFICPMCAVNKDMFEEA
jgi:rubredoxin